MGVPRSKQQLREAARRRKARQRARTREHGLKLETVTFEASSIDMAKLRAAVPLHPKKTLQAVLADAVAGYARQTARATQDLATVAVDYWPKIRPLLPYLSRLASPDARPITVMGRVYTHAEVAPLLPVYRDLVLQVRNLGHTDYLSYLDHLVGAEP